MGPVPVRAGPRSAAGARASATRCFRRRARGDGTQPPAICLARPITASPGAGADRKGTAAAAGSERWN
jgi:hypothetical protein